MTSDQQALISLAEESIQAAKLLRDSGFRKIAISRAYYAMFYLAEAILLVDGLSFSKHSGVIAKFGELFANKGRVPVKFHRYLIDGQEDRLESDYEPPASFTQEEANAHIAHAEEFLTMAKSVIE